MAVVAIFDQAKRATIDQAAQGRSSRVTANTNAFGEPKLLEAEAVLAFEPSVTKKMRVGGTVDYVEVQVRDDEVIELFPHPCAVGDSVFHGGDPVKRDTGDGRPEGSVRKRIGRCAETRQQVTAESRWSVKRLRGAEKEKRRDVQSHSRLKIE